MHGLLYIAVQCWIVHETLKHQNENIQYKIWGIQLLWKWVNCNRKIFLFTYLFPPFSRPILTRDRAFVKESLKNMLFESRWHLTPFRGHVRKKTSKVVAKNRPFSVIRGKQSGFAKAQYKPHAEKWVCIWSRSLGLPFIISVASNFKFSMLLGFVKSHRRNLFNG